MFPCEQNIKAQLSYMTGKTKRAVMRISELLQLSQGHLGSHFDYKLGRLQIAWSYLFFSPSSNPSTACTGRGIFLYIFSIMQSN